MFSSCSDSFRGAECWIVLSLWRLYFVLLLLLLNCAALNRYYINKAKCQKLLSVWSSSVQQHHKLHSAKQCFKCVKWFWPCLALKKSFSVSFKSLIVPEHTPTCIWAAVDWFSTIQTDTNPCQRHRHKTSVQHQEVQTLPVKCFQTEMSSHFQNEVFCHHLSEMQMQ